LAKLTCFFPCFFLPRVLFAAEEPLATAAARGAFVFRVGFVRAVGASDFFLIRAPNVSEENVSEENVSEEVQMFQKKSKCFRRIKFLLVDCTLMRHTCFRRNANVSEET
jgi:hypothetical protein